MNRINQKIMILTLMTGTAASAAIGPTVAGRVNPKSPTNIGAKSPFTDSNDREFSQDLMYHENNGAFVPATFEERERIRLQMREQDIRSRNELESPIDNSDQDSN